jgi:hypothetical protein
MPELSSALRDLIDRSLSPVDVDAIVSARRRRRFRRRVGGASIVVVIATLVTGSVLARPVHEPKTLSVVPGGKVSEPDATRAVLGDLTILSPGEAFLLMVGASDMSIAGGAVNVTDPQSGQTLRKPFPIRLPNTRERVPDPVVRGAYLVMTLGTPTPHRPNDDSSYHAYVVSSTLDRGQTIGPHATTAIASLDPDRVWLADRRSVTEVSLDGVDVSMSHPLTDDRTPLAAVAGGLLTIRPGPPPGGHPALEVWDPATNRVVRGIPSPQLFVNAGGDYVVSNAHTYCAELCPRHVLDLRSGRERVVPPPPHMEWDEAVFSPDGRQLAMSAHAPLTRAEASSQSPFLPAGSHASIVSIVDLSTGRQTQHSVTTWKGRTPLAWSPDGSLLFLTRDDNQLAYFNTRFAHSPTRTLTVPRADAFVVAMS